MAAGQTSEQVAVDITDVSVAFGPKVVLNRVNLKVRQGEVVAVIGRSGVGKSTMLNLLLGIVSTSRGSAKLGERTPSEATRARQIGCFFQRPTLLPWLTGAQNVALPLATARGASPVGALRNREIANAVEEAMTRAKITGARDLYPSEMSGGMQTRVALARTLVYEPPVILLDEPFAALDEAVRTELYSELEALLARRAPAIILVTHNILEAALLSDRVCVLGAETGKPGATIVKSVDFPLPRPRTLDVLALAEVREKIMALREGF